MLTVGGDGVYLDDIVVDGLAVRVDNVEETWQSRGPFGLGVILHITFGLQSEQQRDNLLDGIVKVGSQVAHGELHLPVHIVETL